MVNLYTGCPLRPRVVAVPDDALRRRHGQGRPPSAASRPSPPIDAPFEPRGSPPMTSYGLSHGDMNDMPDGVAAEET